MTDQYVYDLTEYRDRLADHEHASGCPAKPERIEVEIVRRPDVQAYVQRGTTPDGDPIMAKAWVDGEPLVKVRCVDCSVQRLIDITEPDLAGLRVG